MSEVRCVGCGSAWTDEDIVAERLKRPGMISCCPERQPLDITGWMARAVKFEQQACHSAALVERAMDRLADVPGNTLDERLTKFISYYMGLQVMVEDLKAADRDHLAAKRGMETRLTAEIERLRAFVRQVANCEQSDNQNIRRAREIMAQLSSTESGVVE